MNGSDSLEVVRNMKRMSLFTALMSLVLTIGMGIAPDLLATIGTVAYLVFISISTYLFVYSMKQYALWTANETRLVRK